ncbi:11520_t:CDS:2, partial [Racocetra fulgida]
SYENCSEDNSDDHFDDCFEENDETLLKENITKPHPRIKCNYCSKTFERGLASRMQMHLNSCLKAPNNAKANLKQKNSTTFGKSTQKYQKTMPIDNFIDIYTLSIYSNFKKMKISLQKIPNTFLNEIQILVEEHESKDFNIEAMGLDQFEISKRTNEVITKEDDEYSEFDQDIEEEIYNNISEIIDSENEEIYEASNADNISTFEMNIDD